MPLVPAVPGEDSPASIFASKSGQLLNWSARLGKMQVSANHGPFLPYFSVSGKRATSFINGRVHSRFY
jgi:hypothetical protein